MTKNVHATSPLSSIPQATVYSTVGLMEALWGLASRTSSCFCSKGHNSDAANMLNAGLFHCGVRIAALPQIDLVGVVTFTLSPDVPLSAAL